MSVSTWALTTSRESAGRDRFERLRDLREPALGDRVAKRRLARKVAVDAAVADPERAGDVDDIRLRRAETAEALLRRFQDPLGSECLGRHGRGTLVPLAVENRHLLGLVALPGDRLDGERRLDPREVVGGELDLECAE